MKAKKKTKYLELYNKWIQTIDSERNLPTMPEPGLCISLEESLEIFVPTIEEYNAITLETRKRMQGYLPSEVFWAATGSADHFYDWWMNSRYFSPLRQNIVLLLAAMNDEL